MSERPDLSVVAELLERERDAEWHSGAQCYVSRYGEPLLDVAIGESRPGRRLALDDQMLWYSAGKPLTTTAVLRLWERGQLALDDPVADYIDGWGAGKERCTLRHVLVHTGGFTMSGRAELFDRDISYAEAVERIAAHPAEWEPGTAAAYHPTSGWKILGAIVAAVDGRSIDRYLHDEIFTPLGLTNCRLGISVDDQQRLGERIAPVYWQGHSMPVIDHEGLRMAPYRVDKIHNEPWHIAKVEPGGGARGPARELGRFYESLLGFGPPVLDPRTVEVMGAVHRYGMKDALFGRSLPWGLGVQVALTGGTGRRAFGHGGMASSRALADPEFGLVISLVTNGLAEYLANEQRLFEITDAVYRALGADVARTRTEAKPITGFGSLST